MTCLDQAIKASALKAAWTKVSRGKLGKPSAAREGADGESLRSFATRADERIASMASRLRGGKYEFSSLDPYFIPKPNGKVRVICAPCVSDRIVQRSLLDVLSARQGWLKNPISYGFVSERGVELAAKKAVEYRNVRPWVFKTDITKFFDCVDRDLLRKKIRQEVRQRSLHPLMLAAVDCEIRVETDAQAARIRKQGIHSGRGVRQGMPLSPFFANLFMAAFDKACVMKGICALRYADDLIFFAHSQEEAIELAEFCSSELSKLKLEIPEIDTNSKSQVYAPDAVAEFLGVELAPGANSSYHVRVGQEQLNAIKSAIYDLGSIAELRQRGLDVTRFGNSLAARCASFAAAYEYCENSRELEASLVDWAKVARSRIASELGINVSALDKNGRWFLGLD